MGFGGSDFSHNPRDDPFRMVGHEVKGELNQRRISIRLEKL